MITPRDALRGSPLRGTRTYLSTGAGLLMLALVLVYMEPATPELSSDCELTFEPAHVEAGNDSITVRAIPSEEVGEFDNVAADPDSGLGVALIPDRGLDLLVDASEGKPGDWNVSLNQGEMPRCSGLLTVREPQF